MVVSKAIRAVSRISGWVSGTWSATAGPAKDEFYDRMAAGNGWVARFKSCPGLAPRASEAGETDRKGQPMSRAGPSPLRSALIRAAESARLHDLSSPGSTCR